MREPASRVMDLIFWRVGGESRVVKRRRAMASWKMEGVGGVECCCYIRCICCVEGRGLSLGMRWTD